MAGRRKCDVLFIQYPNADYYPPTINGLREMAERGLAVDVLCCEDWPASGVTYPDAVTVTRIKGKRDSGWTGPLFFLRFLIRAFWMATMRRPKVIYGCNLQGIVAAGLIGEALSIPYVHHCYDLYLLEEGMGAFDRKLKPLEKLFSKRALSLVFPSESKAQLFFETSGIARGHVIVANSPARQPDRRTDLLRTAIRNQGGDPKQIVLYQGSIGPGCGIDTLIRSIPFWPEGTSLALLGIVRPREFMDELLALAESLGVAGQVFYLGLVNYDELLDYTRSADLGIFLPTKVHSNYQTSGTAVNKVMEYMACGIPSLVTQCPPLTALMAETGAGVAVDASDPEAIGLAAAQMLTDRSKWEQYSRSARKAHLEKYHFEFQYKTVVETLCRFRSA